MQKSFRRLLGFGLLGAMLMAAIPTFAAPQHSGKKSGKKAGKKGSQKKGGRGGSK